MVVRRPSHTKSCGTLRNERGGEPTPQTPTTPGRPPLTGTTPPVSGGGHQGPKVRGSNAINPKEQEHHMNRNGNNPDVQIRTSNGRERVL